MLIITSWDKMTSCRIEKKMGHFFNSDPESTLLPKRRYNQHQCSPNSQYARWSVTCFRLICVWKSYVLFFLSDGTLTKIPA